MIQHHVLALLCLVAAAISGVEALVQYQVGGLSAQFGLMIVLFAGSIWLYLRTSRIRREKMRQGKR
jgi:hypothetical protein